MLLAACDQPAAAYGADARPNRELAASPASRGAIQPASPKAQIHGKPNKGAQHLAPSALDQVRTGRLCVAPLDDSPTPGRGASTGGRLAPAKTKAVVHVNGVEQVITRRRGAQFDGLPLRDAIDISLNESGLQPYFVHKLQFDKEQVEVLCLYDNAFYGTVQISDRARRPYCSACMRDGQLP